MTWWWRASRCGRWADGRLIGALEERQRNRSKIQLVVSLAIIVAFLATALSGLALTYPSALLQLVGISLLGWRSVHTWVALVPRLAVGRTSS